MERSVADDDGHDEVTGGKAEAQEARLVAHEPHPGNSGKGVEEMPAKRSRYGECLLLLALLVALLACGTIQAPGQPGGASTGPPSRGKGRP